MTNEIRLSGQVFGPIFKAHVMKLLRVLLAVISFFLLCVAPARAWDSLGHMLIAQIAEDQLSPEARGAIGESMARFNEAKKGEFPSDDATYDMVTASCWMDDIRSLREKYNFGPWHYINLPIGDKDIPPSESEHEPNVRWGVQRCADIIAGKVDDQEIDKDQALVMLLHLAGDTHQPMHTANRNNDLGGNKVELKGVELTKEENSSAESRRPTYMPFGTAPTAGYSRAARPTCSTKRPSTIKKNR